MKNWLYFLTLFISFFAAAQTPQTSYVVTTIAAMKSYDGVSYRVYVAGTNADYVICSACTPDEQTIYAGAAGRKWQMLAPVGDTLVTSNSTTKIASDALYNRLANQIRKQYVITGNGSDQAPEMNTAIEGGNVELTVVGNVQLGSTVNIPAGTIIRGQDGQLYTASLSQTLLNFTGDGIAVRDIELSGPAFSVYNSASKAVTIFGTAPNYKRDYVFENVTFINFSSIHTDVNYGENIFFEFCRFFNIGYAGIRVFSGTNVHANKCAFRNIGPGVDGNAYAVTFSRNGTTKSLTSFPRAKNCSVANSTIIDNPIWEALDTHAGEDIRFINNLIRNCKQGIVLAPSHATGMDNIDDYAPRLCEVQGNRMYGLGIGRGIVVSGAVNRGVIMEYAKHNIINNNYVEDYGEEGESTTSGGIYLSYAFGTDITNNTIHAARVFAINFYTNNLYNICINNIITDVFDNDAINRNPVGIAAARAPSNSVLIEENTISKNGLRTGTWPMVYGIRVHNSTNVAITMGKNYISGVTEYFGTNEENTRWLNEDGTSEFEGSGSPEAVITAPVGSKYTNTTGGPGFNIWIKETGTGNTGWIAYGASGSGVSNQPPTANAGSDKTITFPTNTSLLQGEGEDVDGIVTSAKWTKLSGPSSFELQNSTALQTTVKSLTQGVYIFELHVTDNRSAVATDTIIITVNDPPSVNAGPDQTITLPVNAVVLQGNTTDTDGSITYVQWNKITGPSTYRIQDAASPETMVDTLAEGSYSFELVAADNHEATTRDTILITVNPAPNIAPIANAGTDINITLPANTASLSGTASDSDGTITVIKWSKVSGPPSYSLHDSTALLATAGSLKQGVYFFELHVTDDHGDSTKDSVRITVNSPPVVNAGNDQIITLPTNNITLQGNASDEDGTVTTVKWEKISGPSSYHLQDTGSTVTKADSLVEGTYLFELQVTDNHQAIASDTVSIKVLPAPNKAPTANAGQDKTITLPANSVTLSGSGTDLDGTIISYNWTKFSGPAQGTIANANSATTNVTALVAGSYIFRLTVKDNKGATASDDVAVTVNNAPPPVNGSKTIRVNIYGGTNPYVNTSWNNWSIPPRAVTNISSAAFKYADKSTSAISATLSHSTNVADNGASYGSGMAPAEVLRYTSYYNNSRTLTIKGMSKSKKYNIELYASRNSTGNSTIFTINGVSRTIATYKNLTNKAVFSNISPNTSGQIVISIGKTAVYNYINGFTIAENTTTTGSVAATQADQAEENTEEKVLPEATTIYPNPVANKFVLKLNNNQTGLMSIQIISVSGIEVKRLQFTKQQQFSQHEVFVKELAAGVYFVRIQIGGWRASKIFVKL